MSAQSDVRILLARLRKNSSAGTALPLAARSCAGTLRVVLEDPASNAATVLDALFPDGAKSVLSFACRRVAQLTEAEHRASALFAPRRLDEFRHGRDCARRALARLGVEPVGIPIGERRQPVWPPGIVGSISHAGDAAAAVVAKRAAILSLGLDIEPAVALEDALITRICLPGEIRRELIGSERPGESAKLIFSMKEAVYKALWPVTGEFLGFHDVEVRIDRAGSGFAVVSHASACPPDVALRLEGRFCRVDEIIAAGVTLRTPRGS